MDLVTRTVVGTWKIFKGNEGIVPHTGRVVFTPSSVVIDSNSGSVVLDSPIVGTLDSEGVLSIEIPTTDQAGLSPSGWYWKVTEVINNNKIRSYLLVLPTSASVFDLADIDTETSPPTPGENYTLLTTFDAHTHTEDEVTDLGVYPDATGAPSNKVAETDGSDGWVLIDTPAGGATDHGALTGLGDDDHSQYALDSKVDSLEPGDVGADPTGTAASEVTAHRAEDDDVAHPSIDARLTSLAGDIDTTVQSDDVRTIDQVTQAEYDALTPDADTLYVVVG